MSVDKVVNNVLKLAKTPSNFKRVVGVCLGQLGYELLDPLLHSDLRSPILIIYKQLTRYLVDSFLDTFFALLYGL